MTSAHKLINPSTLAPPLGFSHAAVAAEGRTVYLGGQTAHGPTGILQGSDIVEQFDAAAANVVTALKAVGGEPEDLVSMQIFVTDADAYRGPRTSCATSTASTSAATTPLSRSSRWSASTIPTPTSS